MRASAVCWAGSMATAVPGWAAADARSACCWARWCLATSRCTAPHASPSDTDRSNVSRPSGELLLLLLLPSALAAAATAAAFAALAVALVVPGDTGDNANALPLPLLLGPGGASGGARGAALAGTKGRRSSKTGNANLSVTCKNQREGDQRTRVGSHANVLEIIALSWPAALKHTPHVHSCAP